MCLKLCTNKNKLEDLCLSSCYHKYINTLSNFLELTKKEGKEVKSDYVTKAFEFQDFDVLDYFIFPLGGSPWHNILVRFKHDFTLMSFFGEGISRFDKSKENSR